MRLCEHDHGGVVIDSDDPNRCKACGRTLMCYWCHEASEGDGDYMVADYVTADGLLVLAHWSCAEGNGWQRA